MMEAEGAREREQNFSEQGEQSGGQSRTWPPTGMCTSRATREAASHSPARQMQTAACVCVSTSPDR